jgi:CRP/FNR family transcriptional regulator
MLAGSARIFLWTPTGRQLTVRYATPGDIIGLGTLTRGATNVSGAEAATDITLGLFSFEHLRGVAQQEPSLAWAIAEQIADWSTTVLISVVEAGSETMRARVARHLLALASPVPEGPPVLRITHERLADVVGTVREVITRILGEFREEGAVATPRRGVIVIDPARLARISEEGTRAAPAP